MTRAMLSIYKNRSRCPRPDDYCKFRDSRTGECGVRLMSEAAMGELLLRELNRLNRSDLEISDRLDVARATVSRWRHGRAKMPERRMCQLELMLAEALDTSKTAVAEDIVVVGSHDKLIHAVNPKSGRQLWAFPTRRNVDGSPVIVGNRVFIGSDDGRLYALDRKTGKAIWQFEVGGSVLASPAVAAGRLVIGTDNGDLYCFGAK